MNRFNTPTVKNNYGLNEIDSAVVGLIEKVNEIVDFLNLNQYVLNGNYNHNLNVQTVELNNIKARTKKLEQGGSTKLDNALEVMKVNIDALDAKFGLIKMAIESRLSKLEATVNAKATTEAPKSGAVYPEHAIKTYNKPEGVCVADLMKENEALKDQITHLCNIVLNLNKIYGASGD